MPREHGRKLAELLPKGSLVEIDDAYVLSMLDRPEAVAAAMSAFLTSAEPSPAPPNRKLTRPPQQPTHPR
jgi:hypothetical protein